jgi:hypothetical protein
MTFVESQLGRAIGVQLALPWAKAGEGELLVPKASLLT